MELSKLSILALAPVLCAISWNASENVLSTVILSAASSTPFMFGYLGGSPQTRYVPVSTSREAITSGKTLLSSSAQDSRIQLPSFVRMRGF
ncbi:hypothetical protein OGATHE_003740 [Ogataea polymorpha]|uniref:Secreted protein n=1 Tax=Ogataea polymorpha TaxID=460523 RepID=A0A9P8T4C6_9ASCO|nr:hypothetical protein OGATHE_003740 [Ogataea polymorpha]